MMMMMMMMIIGGTNESYTHQGVKSNFDNVSLLSFKTKFLFSSAAKKTRQLFLSKWLLVRVLERAAEKSTGP